MNDLPLRAWLVTHHAPARIALNYSSIAEHDVIIAVDGGYHRCLELGLKPSILIGDFDSIQPKVLETVPQNCRIVRHPAQKNETDTQLALQYCLASGIGEIVICNGMDGRFDHSLALVQNLIQAQRHGLEASIAGENQIAFILKHNTILHYPKGTLLSLVSLSETAEFTASSGLLYTLENLSLHNWDSRGISNIATCSEQSLTFASGLVLAVVTLPETRN